MLNWTGTTHCCPLGPSSMAVPAMRRGDAVGFVAACTVTCTFEATAPGGIVSVTVPPRAVTTPPFTPITAPSFTVTCAEAECPPAVAVIVAEPIDTPVIMPDVDTVARDWSELVHVTSNERGFPATSLTVALSCAVAFGNGAPGRPGTHGGAQ